MKKITLSILALYIGVLAVFSQTKPNSDSAYRQRKLTFAEANIVSSYYSQDGNNSAITGGIGTEKLTDFQTVFPSNSPALIKSGVNTVLMLK